MFAFVCFLSDGTQIRLFSFVPFEHLNQCLVLALDSSEHLLGFINAPEALVQEEAGHLVQYIGFLSDSVSVGLPLNLSV